MSTEERHILSLCDLTGNWPSFYRREEGYVVHLIDLQNGGDVRLMQKPPFPVHGILAAPPCDAMSVSGAQYWPAKDADGRTLEALAIVDACLRLVVTSRKTLAWWALENPIGRLNRWLGEPTFTFDPCDFAGWGSDADAYTKRTNLWGEFTPPTPGASLWHPEKHAAHPRRVSSQGSWLMKLGGKSQRTKNLRSATPLGFARAFREANP